MGGKTIWALLGGVLALGCGERPPPAVRPEPPRSLALLHSSDLHSRLWPFQTRISPFEAQLGLGKASALEEVGGAARLASLLEQELRRGPALWLDSGDMLEGAPVFQRYRGRVEVELFGSLGLGAMALGNHELSLCAPELAELLAKARFPVLAANLRPRPTSPLAGWLQSSVVLNAGQIRVGVVGVANPSSPPQLKSAGNPWDLVVAEDWVGEVQLAVDELTPHAALVVVLSHLGLEDDRRLVQGTTGIDIVLGGHQHILTPEPAWEEDCSTTRLQEGRGCSARRVPIVHSGAYSQWLTRLRLTLAPDPGKSGQLEIDDVTITQLPSSSNVVEAPFVREYLDAYRPGAQPPLAFLTQGVSRISAVGGDCALGNLSCDAVLAATGADAVVLNSSGLREDLQEGLLLRSDLELAFPFEDAWRLTWLSGAQLREGLERAARKSAARDCQSALQVAGLRLKIRCSACAASSPGCLEIERPGASALADEERLLLALPSYLTLPGADFELAADSGAPLELSLVDELAQRFRAASPLRDLERCQRELPRLSLARCGEAFGRVECPLDAEAAATICRGLSEPRGERDGRIQLVP